MRAFCAAVFAILLIALPVCAKWDDTSTLDNALTVEEKSITDSTVVEDADMKTGVKSLWRSAVSLFKEKLADACASSFAILGICALIGIAKGFVQRADSKIADKALEWTGVLAIAFTVIKVGVISQSITAVSRLDTFSKILTPTYAVAAAVAKHPASAVATASATLIFTNIITSLTLSLIFPLITTYAVACCVGSVSSDSIITKICGVLRWVINSAYKVMLIGFTCYISMTGVISAGADVLSVKTAKAVLSGSVPVVGGIIADASDAILSGAAILKGSIGIYGFLGVCGICLVPFVSLFVYVLCYKVISAFAGGFCGGAVTGALEGITSAYSLCLSALGACSAVQFISIVVTAAVSIY